MINIERLKYFCELPYEKFTEIINYNEKNDYYFKDNKSNILAVAHLDSVLPPSVFDHCKFTYSNKEYVFSPTLDDRLGAYIILEVLPALGIKYDILLTNNEETMNSTASNFKPNKKYNWIFQFDRKGHDVVTYNYKNTNFIKALKDYFIIGIGSYTDICELEHLKCCGVNIGCAYYKAHTKDCYCSIPELVNNINKFIEFYNKYHNVRFPHKPKLYYYHKYYKWENVNFVCPYCGSYLTSKFYCNTCNEFVY